MATRNRLSSLSRRVYGFLELGVARSELGKRHYAAAFDEYSHFQRPHKVVRWRGIYTALGISGMGTFLYIQSLQEVPFTHRKHSIWLTNDMEKALGVASFRKLKEEAQQTGTLLPEHHPAMQRVKRVGRRLVQSSLQGSGGGYQQHMKDLDWEFAVIYRDDPNAMVLPGGKVVVHTGLLDLMRSDDELGAVIGHEVAHVLARHVAEKVSKMQIFELVRTLVFWCVGFPIPLAAAEMAVFLPNSRKVETEADIIGMQLAAQCCYNPAASASVFEKLDAFERSQQLGSIPTFLRTHPLSSKRISRVQEELPNAMTTFRSTGCSRRTSDAHSIFRGFAM